MAKEKFGIYVLGYREGDTVKGDAYFSGVGYTLERRVDRRIFPVTIDLSTWAIKIWLNNGYGRLTELSETQRATLSEAMQRLRQNRFKLASLIEKLREDKTIKSRRFHGVHRVVMQKGYREELVERLIRRGTFVYGSTNVEFALREGPVTNGGASTNPTGKTKQEGKKHQ
ncbi:MAG: hypothetical protein J4472_01175 [DPANN group archaeon]|nr:hypothetical protein [DPANN group archaeon]MBS3153486.1 hypothetical protein [Candidatus Woesearchaeota archaeon]